MKFKINIFSFNFIVAIIVLIISVNAFAVTGDTKQLIYITSDIQSIDMQGNVATFIGNVIMTQGTIKIHADKIVIVSSNINKGKEVIDSYGNPVFFYQKQDNGKLLKGHTLHIHYESANDLIILFGNAYLEQLDSNITSDKIIFLLKEHKIQACSKKGNRVTTVLMPFQFQNKNKN